MGAIKVLDLESKVVVTLEDTVCVTLTVNLLDSAKGEVNKAQYAALQEKINQNFIKSMQNIIV